MNPPQRISFISPQKEFSLYWNSFQESELGKIYQFIPWAELCKSLNIRDNRKGRSTLFPPQGKLALMFLKSYTGFSNRKLIENLNGNLHHQLFCGVFLGPEKFVDFKIVSRILTQLSAKLNIPVVKAF